MTNAHNVIAVLTMLMTLSGIGCAGRGFVRQEYVLNPTTGAGAASRHSIGTGVIGGMLAATFVATLFVPVFFRWIAGWRKE